MIILGIDTSCDDTSIAIVQEQGSSQDPEFRILANAISSQIKIHKKWGGVYPALAKRAHQKNLITVLKKALKDSKYLKTNLQNTQDLDEEKIKEILFREMDLSKNFLKFIKKYLKPKIDFIAVTAGPGLEPCLWTGINFAKALSFAWNIPLIPVNHVEGHMLSPWIFGQKIKFPAISLVASGGHTQIVLMANPKKYKILGQTRDDAAGECFDKVARILGLDYPGGPIVEKLAKEQIKFSKKFDIKLPRPMLNTNDFDFSFSGLKTAVLYDYKKRESGVRRSKSYVREMCAETQNAIFDVLIKKTLNAAKQYNAKTIILGGGVSASQSLKEILNAKIKKEMPQTQFLAPKKELSTDNGAMIAMTAFFYKDKNFVPEDFVANSRIKL
ncbi:MAG TPA: tRNA (adenosine(37)-N6)-threonylcarbamoyltransferase complex transferase subunit TsaD [Candidatus Pacearchaeota archaeon]|nr:tRNA (adenosine(37)-N6)-threonylcarbamoyltransferase complex transferase subunit TsaD [Candidatus Pacearchaeota archaeon]HOU45583.1 tRNA (adenosine(37)-N6)-threonylcarbamoyltransferase complex transferase subunit TsaD [Candidatus Pacearchaeota archaeon]HPM08446.1 tRNA (adenosine(37)-N6)-threonylcarbamoyltransferase complex transferase subunit TsaD [Candidatus Pacearchaeota archaeon]HQI74260.1 tRNA (adenosine(37)-N6)-threonylcarbamoyltransferase complex transferase subunit TsaD [Candidatus Pac